MRLRIDIHANMPYRRADHLVAVSPFVAEVRCKYPNLPLKNASITYKGVYVKDVDPEKGTCILQDIHTQEKTTVQMIDIVDIIIY